MVRELSEFSIIIDPVSWKRAASFITNLDVYYSYEYGKLWSNHESGELMAAYYKEGSTQIFYPFIKRKISIIDESLYDIVTPYGYGGPLIQGSTENVQNFYDKFSLYCRENNIITETIRFHPLKDNQRNFANSMDVQYIRKTTAVDLSLPLEVIRKNYSSMVKRNIKKGKKEGITCFLAENNLENIMIFMDLYKETMDRNHASPFYYFDEQYFIEQVKDTNESKTYLLFAEYDQNIVAAVMVIVGSEFSHYHLGASKTDYLHVRPNNMLFDFMIEFCHSKGSSLLHLGGGYQEDDGLFHFKASFTNHNHYDYFIGKKIHCQEAYEDLTHLVNENYAYNPDYFPIYRGIVEKKKIIL